MSLGKLVVRWAGVCALLVGACDDSEKASEKCESLVDTFCDRVVTCAEQGNLLDLDFDANDLRQECGSFLANDARCDQAIRVSDSFGQCVDQSSSLLCAQVNDALLNSSSIEERYLSAIPPSCQDAVVYRGE